MKRMRRLIVFFALWLVTLFSIERIDVNHESAITNMAWFVYVIAVAIVVVLLMIRLRRPQFYISLFWILAGYGLCKMLDYRPIFWGMGKYVTLSEIVILLTTALLVWHVSEALHEFEEAVEAISLPEGRTPLLPYTEVQERLNLEMGRARRLQSPLSVLTIDLDPVTLEQGLHKTVREVQAAMMRRYVQVRVGLLLTRCVRETDIVARHTADGRFVLVAPATSAAQAVNMLKRLAHEVEEQTGIRFRYGVADFPAQALTSEQLLQSSAAQVTGSEIDEPEPSHNEFELAPARHSEHELSASSMPSYATLPALSDMNDVNLHNAENGSKSGGSFVA